MTRPLLIAAVALASYALISSALAAAVALWWRTGAMAPASLPPAARARHLVWLRALPSCGAALITLVLVVPAFAIFEPVHATESIGPLLAVLALAALVQFASALRHAVRLASATWSLERAWLRAATTLDIDPPAGVPAFVVESTAPIVALIGVFSPKLVAARAVIDACSADELTAIVAHERGHLTARDNLKRGLMACAPDALHWTPVHRQIAAAWHHAAEDAADDAATARDAGARVDLAALLLKIARLTPDTRWQGAAVSPFVELDGLDRRVRRLLDAEAPPARSRGAALPVAASTLLLIAILAVTSSPGALKAVFDAVEAVIAFGR